MEYHDSLIWLCNQVLAFGSDQVYTWHGVRDIYINIGSLNN
jgi:hypothetical protein